MLMENLYLWNSLYILTALVPDIKFTVQGVSLHNR